MNSNCKLIIHAHSYCITSGHVFQLQTTKFLRAEAPNVDQEKYKRKPHQPVLTLVQCPISKLREAQIGQCHRKLPGASASSAWQPHRQHPEPGRMSSGPRPVSSHYRTQAPTETVLVGTVTAAKCKMEMAQERMAPAAPSERLRSQNIPPRHTVHGSSHPPLPTTAGYWGVEWDTRKHLKEVITAHQLNRQLTPQDVFQVTLYLTIGHSPFYRFWVLLTLF